MRYQPSLEELEQLQQQFTYHAPQPDQLPRYNEVREIGRQFARTLLECCPPSADRTAAIRKIREAVMTANAAIALEPRP